MGMFDTIEIESKCPNCKHKGKDFDYQTKSSWRSLHVYHKGDEFLSEIDFATAHTSCPKCECWIEAEIVRDDRHRILELKPYEYTIKIKEGTT